MAVSNKNIRIQVTMSKKQYRWLEDFAKKKNITISKLICWLLLKKTRDLREDIKLNDHPKEAIQEVEETITDQEMNEIVNFFENKRRVFP